MNGIQVREVEKFPEPEFSCLNRVVFAEVQQHSAELAATLNAEMPTGSQSLEMHSPMYRLGAYDGQELIGWSCGWMERGRVFYMANSGVVQAHRRRGIYSLLLRSIREYAASNGAVALRSHHSVLNNPVIIAKLRSGFHIAGISQSAQMGTLVELICHFYPQRQELFRTRSLPYVTPDA